MTDQDHHQQVLRELIDLGADLARTVHAQAKADPATDQTVAFDRVARAVRRCIMLAQKLDEPVKQDQPRDLKAQARRHVLRKVENAIYTKAPDLKPGSFERLRAELSERLDAPEFADDLQTRPVAEIIAEICQDLGLHNSQGFPPTPAATPKTSPPWPGKPEKALSPRERVG